MNSMRYIFFTIILTCFCECSTNKNIEDKIVAEVISVKDGDTIEILYNNSRITVRLEHIDCPEKKGGQPFGNEAKEFTSDMCYGKYVTIINKQKIDRYNRLIAVVINDAGLNVNKMLVLNGYAWHFKKHSTNEEYAELEINAKTNRRGLWIDDKATPPWLWRRHNNN